MLGTKPYGFSVGVRNEHCHYIQHLFLIFTNSWGMYTHAPSRITYKYAYVRMHTLCSDYMTDDISILCVMPSNDWMTVNCKGYGRTRLWPSLGHDHWTHLEAHTWGKPQNISVKVVCVQMEFMNMYLSSTHTGYQHYHLKWLAPYVHTYMHVMYVLRKYWLTVRTLSLVVPDFQGTPRNKTYPGLTFYWILLPSLFSYFIASSW